MKFLNMRCLRGWHANANIRQPNVLNPQHCHHYHKVKVFRFYGMLRPTNQMPVEYLAGILPRPNSVQSDFPGVTT